MRNWHEIVQLSRDAKQITSTISNGTNGLFVPFDVIIPFNAEHLPGMEALRTSAMFWSAATLCKELREASIRWWMKPTSYVRFLFYIHNPLHLLGVGVYGVSYLVTGLFPDLIYHNEARLLGFKPHCCKCKSLHETWVTHSRVDLENGCLIE